MINQQGNAIVFAYSRKQAIADGVLIDVFDTARKVGFRYPVAVTAAVWATCVAVPPGAEGEDEKGRLWAVLWVLHATIAKNPPTKRGPGQVLFAICPQNDARCRCDQLVKLKAVCAADDAGSPCIAIMLSEEDPRTMVNRHSWIIQADAPFAALAAVLDYFWTDELGSFREYSQPGHAFVRLTEIANWLNGADWSPDDYVLAWKDVPSEGWKVSAFHIVPPERR